MKRAVLALTLVVLASPSCRQREKYQKPLTPVSVSVVETAGEPAARRYAATIKPASEVTVAFRVGGYVADILQVPGEGGRMRDLQEGDRVERGVVLARIRTDDHRARLRQAESQAESAQATLERARGDFDRTARLFATESATKVDYDAAKSRLDAAEAGLKGARAQVAEAGNALRDTSLRAPLRGVVLARRVERGALVGPDTAAFQLADTGSVKAVFGVPDLQVNSLSIGRPLTVAVEAVRGREFRGRVTQIDAAADLRVRVYDVEVTIPNPEDTLRTGMVASLGIRDAAPGISKSAIVPLRAVVRGDAGGYAVFVIDNRDGRTFARRRPITIGDVSGNTVAVRSGLRAGETVIVTGNTLVLDGEQVRVMADAPETLGQS
jgi:RND family efflux transporter MFP subunit